MRSLCLALFSLILFSLQFSTHANATDAGLRLLESEEYDTAFRESYSAALAGDAKAQFVIGTILLDGLGASEIDVTQAITLLADASSQGFARAAMRLADEYTDGAIVETDETKALEYLLVAELAGVGGLDQRLLENTISVHGRISAEACARFPGQPDEDNEAIAKCIEAGLIEGKAGERWLALYESGVSDGLISAVPYFLSTGSKEFRPREIQSRLSTFYSSYEKPELAKLDTRISNVADNLLEGKKYEVLLSFAKELRSNERPRKVWLKLLEYAAEGSGKANLLLADMYRDGDGVSKSAEKELTYLNRADELKVVGLGQRKHKLETARNPISKNSCKGYNKSDRSNAITLARCADKGFVKRDALTYRIWAFEDGNVNVLSEIAPQLLDRDPIEFSDKLEAFFKKAGSKDQRRLLEAVQTNKDKFKGDTVALYAIGREIVDGTGSLEDGFPYLDLAARQGDICGTVNCKSAAIQTSLYLASLYKNGQFTVEDKGSAIEYTQIAASYGAEVSDELRLLLPDLSQEKCDLFDKFEASDFKDVAKCIDAGFLAGNAAEFWILDFKAGTKAESSFLTGAKRLVEGPTDERVESEFANLLPTFFQKARSADADELEEALAAGPFDTADCEMSSDDLGFQSSGNPVRCVLAAASGKDRALQPAIDIWTTGLSPIVANADYADALREKIEDGRVAPRDLEKFFLDLQNRPREYFEQAQRLLNEDEFLNGPATRKALGFLMGFIATKDYRAFGESQDDIIWVLENVDWNAMADGQISENLIAFSDLPQSIRTDAAQANKGSLKFRVAWMEYLYRENVALADDLLLQFMPTSCEALDFAVEQRRNNPMVFKVIRENKARIKSCSDSGLSEIEVPEQPKQTSENEAVTSTSETTRTQNEPVLSRDQLNKMFDIQEQLAGAPSKEKCGAFGDYLKAKGPFRQAMDGMDLPEMISKEKASIELCKDINPEAASVVSVDSYAKGNWNKALEYGEVACEGDAFDGCGIAARVTYWHQTKKYKDASRQKKIRESKKLARRGWAEKNTISGLVLYDHEINSLCTGVSGDCGLQELMMELDEQDSVGWRVRELRACIIKEGNALTNMLDVGAALTRSKNCKTECAELKSLQKSTELDPVSLRETQRLLKSQKCNK